MILPWDKELSSYDTVEKLATLAHAMELDPLYIMRSITCTRALIAEGSYTRLGLEIPTERELEEMEMDFLKVAIYEEILIRREKRKLEKLIHGDSGNKHWFVTIGFDDKQFKEDNEAMIINPLVKKICDTPGFENVKFVVEKFRKNEKGQIYIHRHVHFVFDSNYRKSKIIQFCFQKVKRYVVGPNFIDVKPDPNNERDKYIRGEKIEAKLECVERDKVWRKEKKITEGN